MRLEYILKQKKIVQWARNYWKYIIHWILSGFLFQAMNRKNERSKQIRYELGVDSRSVSFHWIKKLTRIRHATSFLLVYLKLQMDKICRLSFFHVLEVRNELCGEYINLIIVLNFQRSSLSCHEYPYQLICPYLKCSGTLMNFA